MKTVKNLVLLIIIGGFLTTTSCLKDRDEIDYTPEREDAIIAEYLDSLMANDYNVDTSTAGVYYVMLTEGDGVFPQAGDSIGVKYAGFFPESGRTFDASSYWNQDGIWKFTYKSQNIIPGFEEAIGLLKVGGEGLFLIPSDLAYGSTGSYDGSIPPYSPLVFNIEFVGIYN
jgi:FKBP-type peptidyl-prolyl cis-trans isomerase FkpA